MIGIINYGSGNIIAIKNIFRVIDVESIIINSKEDLLNVNKFVLPGVGDFDECISKFKSLNYVDELMNKIIHDNSHILGICVGMHMLADKSQEGKLDGLGLIPGCVNKFNKHKFTYEAKTPHLGWNQICPRSEDKILDNIDIEKGYYFLHNYHFECNNDYVISETTHGYSFPSIVKNKNIYGVQFHPEKGHKNGMKLFENFNNL